MKQLRKFFSLTSSDRLLLIKAVLLLGTIRVGLKLLPFQQLRGLLAKIAQPRAKLQAVDEAFVNKVAWAVTVASPYLRAVCLPQALATQVLLDRRGYPTQLRIGFTRNKGGQMSAHAWVENQGQVVIGGAGNIGRYISVPIPEVESDESGSWHLFT
ncbi:lasso peptide biosynthesis B2 protein [aff. Roholtiella sp. LEGE 12411]|uniref:lasso peptide biosynthesis B2 protein n=1 Tax=aff. Roholtiella sp. LEGE 12411 TaxID=1828822 RepID=UPI0018813348|nr:lasso peptide biosynthesis B2 protein [aff. Roholtiella sp. LEGE 12411]MBE9036792.1 lasso peptide biosynthesis B2 protein [aff. Roholtiella sp. LEGE 12411]